MRQTILIFVLTVYSTVLSGQNLVLNPSFEQYTTCPSNQDQVSYSTGWGNYALTPDYFNACAAFASQQSVPANFWGSYQPASTGQAYCGFYTTYHVGSYCHNCSNQRDIIGRQLSSPMVIGTRYFASIKVSLAYNGATSSANCATNNIGIKFCVNPISYADSVYVASPLINNFAHIYETAIITDTVNWTTISGSIIADSAYDYILISNFFDSVHTDTMLINPALIFCRAYYYLDDVCVSTDSAICDFTTGINEDKIKDGIEIYPNPAIDNISIINRLLNSNEGELISIYNIHGQLILRKTLQKDKTVIDISNFERSIYFVRVHSADRSIVKKIIKE
jgi:hypothetical protein